MSQRYDIVIAGGGAAGLALALAIQTGAGAALSVAVFDPDLSHTRPDARAFALVPGAIRFFEQIGVWEAMAPEAEPIRGMEITDTALEELVRPALLQFDTDDAGGFGAMVPHRAILAALRYRAEAAGIVLTQSQITSYALSGPWIEARTGADARAPANAGRQITGPETCRARLLVAADGRASRLREQAGLPYYGWSYPQTAIVGTISHSLPHDGIAVQHFLPAGPFAMLPLAGGYCSSIVWCEAPDDAARWLSADEDELVRAIEQRAAGRLGTISAVADVAAFPLSLGLARSFVAPRLALLGDAAHGIHPLAGQGLNYGLRGAAALAETVLDAARLGLDFGSEAALAGYESARRPDVLAIALATEALNRLFSNDLAAVRTLRDLGLGAVERVPLIKRRLMRQAAGLTATAPRSFRGEPL